MVFEAVVICVDNSRFMINGDVYPSRQLSQSEAVNFISSAKISESPETTVGIISMARGSNQVLIPSTRQNGEIIKSLHEIMLGGPCEIVRSLKVAQLVLKNRQNKNQKQRIVMFVGSPVIDPKEILIKQGKILKKNSIALDVIHFGLQGNQSNNYKTSLQTLVNTVNSSNNSNFVHAPKFTDSLTNIVSKEILKNNTSSQENSLDSDPELAMALRMSLEEENRRQSVTHPENDQKTTNANKDQDKKSENNNELARAIAMSLADNNGSDSLKNNKSGNKRKKVSTKESKPVNIKIGGTKLAKKDVDNMLADKTFLMDLIDSLPEVDKNSINIDEVMETASIVNQKNDDGKDKDEGVKEKDNDHGDNVKGDDDKGKKGNESDEDVSKDPDVIIEDIKNK